MGSGSEAVLFDIDGDPMAITNGTAIPAATSSLIGAGSDGINARFIRVNSDGYQIVIGSGTAGSPTGGLITIQGDPSGTPIPISGNITASNASVGTNDAAIPGFSTLIGGSDGTNLRPARIFDADTGGGTQWVLGVGLRKFAGGGSVELGTSSDPIRTDPTGTTTQPISGTVTANQGGSWTVAGTGNFTVVQSTASNLRAQLASETNTGTAVPTTAVQVGGSDGTNSRPIFLDSSGRQIIIGAAADGAATTGNPILIGGSDGANARTIRTATDGTVRVDPTGTTTQPVSGTVTANAGSGTFTVAGTVTANIGTSGSLALDATLAKLTIIPDTAIGSNTLAMVGGHVTTASPTYTNGNINTLSLTTSGALRIDGSAVTQPISGTVTANQGGSWTVAATQSGTWTVQQGTPPWSVVGAAADGATPSGNPILIAGQDGANVQSILTDTTGRQIVVGAAADGAAIAGNPVLIGGTDGANAQTVELRNTHPVGDVQGIIVRNIEAINPTFYAVFDRISPATNKYMATLFNTSSTRKVVIQRVWVYNWQIATVTGVLLEQYLTRITARTAGTSVSIWAEDTTDSLSAGISADTNSSSVTENHILHRFIAYSEEAVTNLGQLSGSRAAGDDNTALVWNKKDGTRGLTLRQNQGVSIRNVTNSAVGTCSYIIEFTDEVA